MWGCCEEGGKIWCGEKELEKADIGKDGWPSKW